MDDILILAGSLWQKPLIEYMKEFYKVHVVNPVATEATEVADNHIKCDIFDIDGIQEELRGVRPLFVTTDQSDVAVVPATQLADKMGLPSNGESIKYFCDKAKCSQLASEIGVPHIKSIEVHNLEEASAAAEEIGFPLVMKPVDSSASKGVYRVKSQDEVRSFFERSIQRSRSKRLLFQECVEGEWQVVVEGFCSGGKHTSVSCGLIPRSWTEKKVPMLPYILWPYTAPAGLIEANDKFVESTSLQFGITHAEYVLEGDEFHLLEIGCRGGGFRISSDIVPWVSGVNLYDLLHRSLLGEVVVPELRPPRSALLQFFQKSEQPSEDVPGVFECRSHVANDFHHNPDNLRHSYLIAFGKDERCMASIIQDIRQRSSCPTLPSL